MEHFHLRQVEDGGPAADEELDEAQFPQQEQRGPHLQRRQGQKGRQEVGQDVAAEDIR